MGRGFERGTTERRKERKPADLDVANELLGHAERSSAPSAKRKDERCSDSEILHFVQDDNDCGVLHGYYHAEILHFVQDDSDCGALHLYDQSDKLFEEHMAQIKIYGLKTHLDRVKGELSDAIHSCVVEVLQLPEDKRAQRFFALDPSDFRYPPGRSEQYTIIEVSMFEGRTIETKKAFIHLLFDKLWRELKIAPNDVEITIFETPRHNWGIRGATGDELNLNYRVDV